MRILERDKAKLPETEHPVSIYWFPILSAFLVMTGVSPQSSLDIWKQSTAGVTHIRKEIVTHFKIFSAVLINLGRLFTECHYGPGPNLCPTNITVSKITTGSAATEYMA